MKILILTCSFGSGHYSAARAIQEQIEKEFPRAQITLCDLIAAAYPKRTRAINQAYSFFTREMQPLYNVAARQNIRRQGAWSFLQRSCEAKLQQKLGDYLAEGPDVLISTYSFTGRLAAQYKEAHGLAVPLVSCITDVEVHPGWVHPQIDLYLAASEQSRRTLEEMGVAPSRIRVTGIPVSERFAPSDRKDQPVKQLLVMGGGLGLLPKEMSFYRELSRLPGVRTSVVCGKNRRLKKKLTREKLPGIEVLGYAGDIPERLKEADMLLTKPGGVAIFEAIEACVPLLLFAPFMQQEQHNYEFILSRELGAAYDEKRGVRSLLENTEGLSAMRRNMAALKRQREPGALPDFLRAAGRVS